MNPHIQSLARTVQTNCHISDARHASDYTLCIYLLKMREFYRWEKQLAYDADINPDNVGAWLTEREALWDKLEPDDFSPIKSGDSSFHSFDSESINNDLLKHGYIYSAGYGLKSKPIFYLGKLEQQILQNDYTIYISGQELARDLAAPVAMSQKNNIFIRKESLHRMIWEKTEEWGWHQNKNAMFKAMNYYSFDTDQATALDAMTNKELNSVILHEIGEIQSAQELKHWHDMLTDLPRSQAEIMCRAVKDMIADAISTLPSLINNREDASIHFYFANFTHMRKELSPSLLKAYHLWEENNDYSQLLNQVNKTGDHWFDIARDILDLYKHHGSECHTYIEALVKENTI